jgi:Na+/glutamate symporter
MAKIKDTLNPMMLTFVNVAIFVVFLFEYKRNSVFSGDYEFRVSMLPYSILLVVGLLGILGPKSQEMFFIVLIISILLVAGIGFIVIQLKYKRKVIWK